MLAVQASIKPTNIVTASLEFLMIDYRLLRALAAVMEQGGFERAAAHLHLTQSAVSQRIKQLEHQLGQPVLIRSTPPRATELGQRLHHHWQHVQLLESGLALTGDSTPLTIRIAVNADSLATWLPAALVLPAYQDVCFEVVVEDQAVGLRRMRQGDVMACLCGSSEPVNGGRVVPAGNLRYRAVASPDFIERHKLRQDITRLAQAPCLVFNRDDPLQHRFLADVGAGTPQHIHLLPSSEGFVQAALAGLGFGMIPALQVDHLIQQGRLRDVVPQYHLDTPLYWHYWASDSPVLAALRQRVLQVARDRLFV